MKTSIKAEFKVFNTNGKGQTSIGLVLKGDLSDTQILALHRLKSEGVVFADLFNGQAEMDDYDHDDETSEEPHKGMAYSVDKDGTAQLTLDDLENIHPDNDAIVESIASGHDLSDSIAEANEEAKKDELDEELF